MTSTGGKSGTSRLDHYMPHWHFRERHVLAFQAPHEKVMEAARELTWREAPVARFLMTFTRNRLSGDGRVMDDFAMGGETVLELTDDELVYGGIGDNTGPATLDAPMPEVFGSFREPGFTKIGFNVRYAGGVLSTETRILATDAGTKRSFGKYWLLIRIPSGIIRKDLLRAIRQRSRNR